MTEFGALWKHLKTSMHCGLVDMTLSQLAFPGEGDPNFPQEKSQWDKKTLKKGIKGS